MWNFFWILLEKKLGFLSTGTVTYPLSFWVSDKRSIGIFLACRFSTNCLSRVSYLEMPSYSTDEGEVPRYAYVMLRFSPPFPTQIAMVCHHTKTNYSFLHCGRVGPSPLTKIKRVEIFLLETLIYSLGLDYPLTYLFNKMHLYWEQIVSQNYRAIKYSLLICCKCCFKRLYRLHFQKYWGCFGNCIQNLCLRGIIWLRTIWKSTTLPHPYLNLRHWSVASTLVEE
jgi:hypothetical protein